MTSTEPTVVTQQDVADKAGVSWRTVHRVINDPGLVNENTREAVEKVIAELGFVGEKRNPPPGPKPFRVPLVHPVQAKVDARTRDELARRGAALTQLVGVRKRGWDAEILRLALDWAFNPPEGVAPMPDDYEGFVRRMSDPL